MDQLIAENLCKTYVLKEKTGFLKPKKVKKIEAVKGINLKIPKGKIVGLLGINGAGKTTTIRILSAIIEPSSGSLLIDGVNAIKNHVLVKSKINMITGGERNLYWRLTAKENLAYFGRLYGISGSQLNERITKLLSMVGLSDVADMPVERYSKGMKQRLQIARGLINDPSYLFLDEPTLGLDVIIAKEMRQYIANLAEKENKGLLLTTHYISEAEELCDYIYVIDKGTVIAEGSKEQLKKLFSFKQELSVTVSKFSDDFKEKIRSTFQEEVNISYENNDNSSEVLKIVGDSSYWPKVISLINSSGLAIISISNNEPNLEEVLLTIIKDYRDANGGTSHAK